MVTWQLLAVAFGSATVALTMIVVWQLVERAQVRRRYAPIRDVERELAKRRHAFHIEMSTREGVLEGELEGKRRAMEHALATHVLELDAARRELADLKLEAKVLQGEHTGARQHADRLRAELAELEQAAGSIEVGLAHRPPPPGASAEVAHRLVDNRAQQKAMAHGDRAVTCWTPWTAGGRRDGEQIQKQVSRLLIRAFNAECEAAIAQVRWNNLTQMVVRITHAFGALNKLTTALELELTPPYRALKLEELRLEHACLQGRADSELHDADEPAPPELDRVPHDLERSRDDSSGRVCRA